MTDEIENNDMYDDDELRFQTHEKEIREISLHEVLGNKSTKYAVQECIQNYYYDYVEPLVEKSIEQWKIEYGIEDNIYIHDLLSIFMFHINTNSILSKQFVYDNP